MPVVGSAVAGLLVGPEMWVMAVAWYVGESCEATLQPKATWPPPRAGMLMWPGRTWRGYR